MKYPNNEHKRFIEDETFKMHGQPNTTVSNEKLYARNKRTHEYKQTRVDKLYVLVNFVIKYDTGYRNDGEYSFFRNSDFIQPSLRLGCLATRTVQTFAYCSLYLH